MHIDFPGEGVLPTLEADAHCHPTAGRSGSHSVPGCPVKSVWGALRP